MMGTVAASYALSPEPSLGATSSGLARREVPPPAILVDPLDLLPELSPREREIARLVAKGYPNKVIAAILDISPWTVATYLRRIYAKLGVRCRAAMVSRLFHLGIAS